MTDMLNFKPPKYRRPELYGGFTLLEVLVSIAIIAIVLVSIIRLQGQTILMNASFRFYTIAPLLAQSKISEILKDPSNMDLSSSGDFGDDFPGYTWELKAEDVDIPMNEETQLDVKQVDVTISLNNGDIKYTFRQFLRGEPES